MKTKRRHLLWVWLLPFLWLLFGSTVFSQETITLPCEVMESSSALKSSIAKLNGVRYLLLHHANSADRETLSKWLTAHNGVEVTFAFKDERHKAILCRLAHCFGRGLLIYTADVQPVKRDIIEVFLPRFP